MLEGVAPDAFAPVGVPGPASIVGEEAVLAVLYRESAALAEYERKVGFNDKVAMPSMEDDPVEAPLVLAGV